LVSSGLRGRHCRPYYWRCAAARERSEEAIGANPARCPQLGTSTAEVEQPPAVAGEV
jgi:hypothetical protein